MNGGALNSYVINGSALDPVVRAAVGARAYALVSSVPRVFAYLAVGVLPTARLNAPLGRVRARSQATSAAKAEISGLLYRVRARLIIAVTATANVGLNIALVRAITRMTATASAVVVGRVFVRSGVYARASAFASTVVRPRFKAIVSGVASAIVEHFVRVRPREYHRAPTTVNVAADVGVLGAVFARLRAHSVLRASVTASPKYLIRSPVAAVARADTLQGFSVVRRIPWDEPAPDERTFKVNPEVFTFQVVA